MLEKQVYPGYPDHGNPGLLTQLGFIVLSAHKVEPGKPGYYQMLPAGLPCMVNHEFLEPWETLQVTLVIGKTRVTRLATGMPDFLHTGLSLKSLVKEPGCPGFYTRH